MIWSRELGINISSNVVTDDTQNAVCVRSYIGRFTPNFMWHATGGLDILIGGVILACYWVIRKL